MENQNMWDRKTQKGKVYVKYMWGKKLEDIIIRKGIYTEDILDL